MDHTVTPADNGRKLRDVLRSTMSVSYSAMKSAKWDHRILVNGEAVRIDSTVYTNDVITVLWANEKPLYTPKPYDLPLNIIFRDSHLMVIDKQAPLASQSSLNHPDDSLENAVFSYLGCPENFIYRPVNRLDKGTSGLMIVALTPHDQHLLQQQLHTPALLRSYLAVTEGIPASENGTLSFPIAKIPEASVKRMVAPEGKPSVTHYRVLQKNDRRALVSLKLETGRTHQIRVHLSHIGCPVCGDFLYGTELSELPGRFALHSADLSFVHPATGETLTFHSPLPECLQKLLIT